MGTLNLSLSFFFFPLKRLTRYYYHRFKTSTGFFFIAQVLCICLGVKEYGRLFQLRFELLQLIKSWSVYYLNLYPSDLSITSLLNSMGVLCLAGLQETVWKEAQSYNEEWSFQLSLDDDISNVIRRKDSMNEAYKYGLQLAQSPCWRWPSAFFIVQ